MILGVRRKYKRALRSAGGAVVLAAPMVHLRTASERSQFGWTVSCKQAPIAILKKCRSSNPLRQASTKMTRSSSFSRECSRLALAPSPRERCRRSQ